MNKNITIDSLDVPNPRADHDGPWSLTPRPAPRVTWDVEAVRWLGAIGASAVAWYALPWYVSGLGIAVAAAAALKRFVFSDRIGGVEVRVWRNDVRGTDIVRPMGVAAVEHARRALPNVSSYSPSLSNAHEYIDSTAEEVTQAVLPAPIQVGPLPIAAWLPRLDEQPHAIFAAKTKGGKSTMAKAGLKTRIDRGEDIFVIDPHSNGWLDLPGVGGGCNWQEIEDAMEAIVQTYHARMAERERYIRETGDELPHDHFPRITVVFDEANESRTMIERRHTPKLNPWPLFVDVMGSGARKVGISLWLICQSALIKNLGGSTVMRRNFTTFALDHETIIELIEDSEPIKERREAIIAQLGGLPFPATAIFKGQAFLLDRTGLDQIQPGSAADCAWGGWDYVGRRARNAQHMRATPYATRSATVATSLKMPSMASASVALRSATPVAQLNDAQRDELVRILRRKRDPRSGRPMAQDAIRAKLEQVGLSIAQSRLVALCQEVDREGL